jgi:hypothetical protein
VYKICIFCDSRANSNEDVFPKWVIKLLRKHDDEIVPMKTHRLQQPPKEYLTAESALTVGNVCEGCNNGWMSRLENDVKPIFSPMILGASTTLTASQQRQITVWLTKTAMMFDGMDKGEVFYDGLDRKHFRRTLTPFSDTPVWLGHYAEADDLRGSALHQTLKTKLSSGNFLKMHVLTMTIGHLVSQIVSVKRMAHSDLARIVDFPTRGPSLNDALIQAWPLDLQDLTWPPVVSMSTDWLKALAYRFGGGGA